MYHHNKTDKLDLALALGDNTTIRPTIAPLKVKNKTKQYKKNKNKTKTNKQTKHQQQKITSKHDMIINVYLSLACRYSPGCVWCVDSALNGVLKQHKSTSLELTTPFCRPTLTFSSCLIGSDSNVCPLPLAVVTIFKAYPVHGWRLLTIYFTL